MGTALRHRFVRAQSRHSTAATAQSADQRRSDAQDRRGIRCMRLNVLFANRIDMLVEPGFPRRHGQLDFREPAPVRGG
jgi:hypothetical protein